MAANAEGTEGEGEGEVDENGEATVPGDSIAGEAASEPVDSTALDPHNREYYLAQIPFTDEQVAQSNNIIKDGLFHSGVIFKDKLDNLRLSEKQLVRLTTQYEDYEKNDEALYHLFLLYSRLDRQEEADHCLDMLKTLYPESQWTVLLSDPHFLENQRFGVHIEDSLYAATYEAFKVNRHQEVKANTSLSASRFPLGQHRPKFLFIEGLSQLNDGDANGCTERMKQVVEEYPQSEVSELAGMILRGVKEGRRLYGGKFDMGDIWSRRSAAMANGDSTQVDTLRFERDVKYVFLLAFQPDSVSQNQLLYEVAKYNFTNFLVRNFDIVIDEDQNGMARMLITGFLSYDEARQYARRLYDSKGGTLADLLGRCRNLIVSEDNLRLLGTTYSYRDYEVFFEKQIAPKNVSPLPLLDEPGSITTEPGEEEDEAAEDEEQPAENAPGDDLFQDAPQQQNNGYIEFDDDFWK